MKLHIIVTAAALACGSAMAAQDYRSVVPQRHAAAATSDSAVPADMKAGDRTTVSGGDTATDKTKRGAHKVGNAIRNAGHKVASGLHRLTHPRGSSSDTRAMGAQPSDSGRQGRMDSAYTNWQKKQK